VEGPPVLLPILPANQSTSFQSETKNICLSFSRIDSSFLKTISFSVLFFDFFSLVQNLGLVGLQVVWESVSSVFKPGMKLEVSKRGRLISESATPNSTTAKKIVLSQQQMS
jgi:hypothetical protein